MKRLYSQKIRGNIEVGILLKPKLKNIKATFKFFFYDVIFKNRKMMRK